MRLLFLSRTADAGNGGASGGDSGASGAASGSSAGSAARPSGGDAVRLALAQHDRNPVKIARALNGEIDRQAGVIRALEADLAKARTSLGAYEKLGKVEDLAKLAGERDALTTKLADAEARTSRQSAAEQGATALGWNAAALRTFADDKGFALAMREVEVDDGKGAKVKKSLPHVVRKDDKGAESFELLDAVVRRDHAAYLPMLTATAGGSGASGSSTATATNPGTTPATGPAYPPQGAGGSAPQGSLFDRIRAEQAEAAKKASQTVNPIDALLNPASALSALQAKG